MGFRAQETIGRGCVMLYVRIGTFVEWKKPLCDSCDGDWKSSSRAWRWFDSMYKVVNVQLLIHISFPLGESGKQNIFLGRLQKRTEGGAGK